MTLVAEALRALSGLGFVPWVAEQRYPGVEPRSRLCCLVPACQVVMAVDQYRSRHAERQASNKNRSVGGRRSPWPLACVPQGPCERRALTLVAEALRALSGLGFVPWVAEQRYPGIEPRSRLHCFVGDKEAEEGRRVGPAVHCEMRANYKASVKRREL